MNLTLEIHPFNDNARSRIINGDATKLILGSFPANQVTKDLNPRIKFYYGSTNNKFWDIILDVFEIKTDITVENILSFLDSNDMAIIDIILKCYRKDNKSSADKDLDSIYYEDIVDILRKTKIDTIYTTSNFVTNLLKRQIDPLLDNKKKKKELFIETKKGDFKFIKVGLPDDTFGFARELNIMTLYSPSHHAIRGITKGLNSKKLDIDPKTYRKQQYLELLK